MLEIKSCVICGKNFMPIRGNQLACSKACSKIRYKQMKRKWIEEHPDRCKAYHKKFRDKDREIFNEKKRIYHRNYYHQHSEKICLKVRIRYKKNAARQRILKKLKKADAKQFYFPFCQTCGKAFVPSFAGEKYCSDACRIKSPLFQFLLAAESDNGY